MSARKVAMRDATELTYDDLVETVRSLQQTLWPTLDTGSIEPDYEWSPDTIGNVAGILVDAGLGPFEFPSERAPETLCHVCAVKHHDTCANNPNCPCCCETIARMNGGAP